MICKLPLPPITASDAFLVCINNTRNYSRFLNAESDIVADEQAYLSAFSPAKLSDLKQRALIGLDITREEMAILYKERFAKPPGRYLYDQIMQGAKFGMCVFCGARDATSLDHYLAKNAYASLAVAPLNLVPSCMKCNSSGKPPFPSNATNQLIHPYFDDVSSARWLRAHVNHTSEYTIEPATFHFSVSRPEDWSDELFERMLNHFSQFELSDLYSVKASDLLSKRQYRLSEVFYVNGKTGVRDELIKEFATHLSENRNSFQTAIYDAAAVDDWFCSGGFGLLPEERIIKLI